MTAIIGYAVLAKYVGGEEYALGLFRTKDSAEKYIRTTLPIEGGRRIVSISRVDEYEGCCGMPLAWEDMG